MSEIEEFYLTEIEQQNNAELIDKIMRDEKLIREEMRLVQRQIQGSASKKPKKLRKRTRVNSTIGRLKREGSVISIISKKSISKYSSSNLKLAKKDSNVGSLASSELDPERFAQLVTVKDKLQRHHTKKQVFAFNVYANHVRQLSDHELFQKKSEVESSSSRGSLSRADERSKRPHALKIKVKGALKLGGESSGSILDLGNRTTGIMQRSFNGLAPL